MKQRDRQQADFSETTALIAVVEQKSFTKAARQLGLSPARVSELVRGLETRVGVRLVDRTTRSVAATTAGERLLSRLAPILDDYRQAFESLNDYRSRPSGIVRVTVAPPAADFVLAPLLSRFFLQFPEITLDLSIDRTFVDIVQGRFDAGIRNNTRIDRDMIAVRISDDMPFVTAASPDYLARRGTPKHPDDLQQHSCIRFRFPNGSLVATRYSKGGKHFEAKIDGPLIASEPAIGIRAAVDGVGIVQLPRAYLASELAAGRLTQVLANWDPPILPGFSLYYSSRRQMRPPLREFVTFLRNARESQEFKAELPSLVNV